MPIVASWNICQENGDNIKMINRTNNAVESYNCRFNRLFSKQPNTIEFNQIVMEESIRHQAETLQNIWTGKKRETVRQKVFVPDIPEEYYSFNDYADAQEQVTRKERKKTINPSKTVKQSNTVKPSKRSRIAEVELPSPPCTPLGTLDNSNGGRPKRKIKRKKLSI